MRSDGRRAKGGGRRDVMHYRWRARVSSRRNDSVSETMPMPWNVPRSASFVTTAGLMSTQTVFTVAGSRLPVAMACSVEASMSERPVPSTCRRIASCALSVSVMTSGSGPSSRIEPESTNGTPRVTHARMMPLLRTSRPAAPPAPPSVRPAAGVDDGGAGDDEDLLPGAPDGAHPGGEPLDELELGFFRRDSTPHELEHFGRSRALQRRDLDPLGAADDPLALPDAGQRRAAGLAGVRLDDDPAVHLDAPDLPPAAAERTAK